MSLVTLAHQDISRLVEKCKSLNSNVTFSQKNVNVQDSVVLNGVTQKQFELFEKYITKTIPSTQPNQNKLIKGKAKPLPLVLLDFLYQTLNCYPTNSTILYYAFIKQIRECSVIEIINFEHTILFQGNINIVSEAKSRIYKFILCSVDQEKVHPSILTTSGEKVAIIVNKTGNKKEYIIDFMNNIHSLWLPETVQFLIGFSKNKKSTCKSVFKDKIQNEVEEDVTKLYVKNLRDSFDYGKFFDECNDEIEISKRISFFNKYCPDYTKITKDLVFRKDISEDTRTSIFIFLDFSCPEMKNFDIQQFLSHLNKQENKQRAYSAVYSTHHESSHLVQKVDHKILFSEVTEPILVQRILQTIFSKLDDNQIKMISEQVDLIDLIVKGDVVSILKARPGCSSLKFLSYENLVSRIDNVFTKLEVFENFILPIEDVFSSFNLTKFIDELSEHDDLKMRVIEMIYHTRKDLPSSFDVEKFSQSLKQESSRKRLSKLADDNDNNATYNSVLPSGCGSYTVMSCIVDKGLTVPPAEKYTWH